MIIGDIVVWNARLYPDKVGIVDEHSRLTWKEVNRRVNCLANAMLGLGLRKGDRVALVCGNSHQFAEFLFAVAKAGLIGVCLNYRLMPGKLAYMIGDCGPSLIFVQDKFAPTIQQLGSGIDCVDKLIVIGEGGDYESLLDAYPADEPQVEVSEQDICLITYTTGTTGTPKGIELTHKNLVANCVVRLLVARIAEDDVYLTPFPLFAIGGLGHLLVACFAGVKIVVPVFSGQSFVELVEREKVTISYLNSVAYRIVRDYLEASERKYDLSSLCKLAIAGGQPHSPEQMKEILDYLHIPYSNANKTYSMSEVATVGTWLLSAEMAAGLREGATEKEWHRLNSVGKAIGNAQVKIVDESDQDVPLGQTGEILLKGDGVMRGYWNKPELTQETLRGGWYHTSDLGFLDEDGYLYFVGRKDFLIKSGGFFVAPEDVENVILQHPAVAEAAAIGIPDKKWGQLVKAVVRLQPGMTATEEDIREHCRKHLSGFQVPKSVDFMGELPREPIQGKIDRQELIKSYSKDSTA